MLCRAHALELRAQIKYKLNLKILKVQLSCMEKFQKPKTCDVDNLIKVYVHPLIEEECKRLKIPRDFVRGVYGCYYKDIEAGRVEEIREGNKLVGVRIRIADCNDARDVLATFFHEIFHVKELLYGDKFLSELRAELYAEKRIFQLALSGWEYLHSDP